MITMVLPKYQICSSNCQNIAICSVLISNQYRRQEYHTARRGGRGRGRKRRNFVVSSRNYKITLIQSGTHFLNYHLGGEQRWVGQTRRTELTYIHCAVLSRLDSFRSYGLQPAGSSVHGDSPGKNTGVGCHALLQGISPTQGLNTGLPDCRPILYHLSHQGSPRILERVAYRFSRGSF